MSLNSILNLPVDLAKLRQTIFDTKAPQNQANRVEDLYLSHTHRVLAQCAQHLLIHSRPTMYGEIGSHIGRSMISIATHNLHVEIRCFDNPNSGWGGQPGTERELMKNLATFAAGRHHLTLGDSGRQDCIDLIKSHGPYDIFMVDGNHEEKHATKDLYNIYPEVRDGGIIIFDDLIHHDYLERVWDRFVAANNPKESIKIMNTTPDEDKNGYLNRGVGIMIK